MKFKLLKFVFFIFILSYSSMTLAVKGNSIGIFKVFYKQALLCDEQSAEEVGTDYLNGLGAPQDYRLAAAWFEISKMEKASTEQFSSDKILDDLYSRMSDNDRKKVQLLTRNLYNFIYKNCSFE